MGLLNNLAGGDVLESARVLGTSRQAAERKAFNRDFKHDDFDSAGGDIATDQFNEIARYQVPADTEYRWGYGSAENPDNQGILYMDIQNDSGTSLDGIVRFVVESATGRKSEVVADFDTSRLEASKTDRTQQVAFPEQVGSPLATQDAYLVVKMKGNSSDTVDDLSGTTNLDWIIPVTEYDLS